MSGGVNLCARPACCPLRWLEPPPSTVTSAFTIYGGSFTTPIKYAHVPSTLRVHDVACPQSGMPGKDFDYRVPCTSLYTDLYLVYGDRCKRNSKAVGSPVKPYGGSWYLQSFSVITELYHCHQHKRTHNVILSPIKVTYLTANSPALSQRACA